MWPCLCAAGAAAAAVATAVAVVLQEHGVSQEQQEEQAAVAAAAANFLQIFAKIVFFLQRFSIFSRVSEATLDTFLVGFSD